MKWLGYLILAASIVSCNRSDEIEVIPDYDAVYLPPEEVDIPVEVIDDEDKHIENIQNIVAQNFKPENEAYYFFKSTLFLNEKGLIEKVKYSIEDPDKDFGDADINPQIEKLFPRLTNYLKNVEFTPAILNGEKVSSQFEWAGSFKVDNKGEAEVYLFSLNLSGLRSLKFVDKAKYMEQVDEMPFPVGGMAALAANIVYPKQAKEEGIQGKVWVKAFIDEEGKVVWTEIIKGIGGGCELAAANAVESTQFTPGKQNGKSVKVQVVIPILFKLQ